MNLLLLQLFLTFIFVRLLSLLVSIKNEQKLKANGAIEYDKKNTILLAITHLMIYVLSFAEGFSKHVGFDLITIVGISLFSFSMIILFIVIYELKDLWTIKLIIAKEHKINNSFLFKYFKHPNYFLNVIPEIIAIILIFKAWLVLLTIFPVYIFILKKRIISEEKEMAKI